MKNYAFIDGQNLHFGIKSMGWKIDHKKFREYLTENHNVDRAYIFLGFMEEHQDLYNVLQEAGFICFFKPLVRYDDGTIKGNVDADMVLQVMVDIENYDGAVIVSGDGDFSGLLRHLMTKKKLGQVIIPNKDKYSSLFDRLDGFDDSHVTYMNDLRNELSYNDGRRRAPQRRNSQQSSRPKTAAPAKPAAPKPAAKKPAQAAVAEDSKTTTDKPAPRRRSPRNQDSRDQAPKRNNSKQQSRKKSSFKPKSELERSLIETIDSQ